MEKIFFIEKKLLSKNNTREKVRNLVYCVMEFGRICLKLSQKGSGWKCH